MQNIQLFYGGPVMLLVSHNRCYLFWVAVVKNRCSLLDHGIENLLYLKNELMEWTDFLHTDANLGKLTINLRIIGWVYSEMGETF